MNDLLYDSFGSSDIVDPLLKEEEERKKVFDIYESETDDPGEVC